MISSGKKIGVDAGSALVKVIELGKGSDGPELARWAIVPWRAAPNATPEASRQMQAKAIEAAIKKSECKCRDIVVGVPGNNAFIRNIKLPPIPSSKIDQIVRYEIQQTIPFPIENIALDYQVLEPDESSEVEVIMVAMKGEVAEAFIRDVEQAKVKVGIVDSIPLALYNCYRYNGYSNKEDCTAVIELGASASNILIELRGELRYCRSVSIGGNDITNALAKEFNIPFEQAERIKIQHGLIFPESLEGNFTEDQVRASKTVAGVLDRLLGEIKLTIGYFRSLTGATAISKAVLAGGSSLLRNIRPFLADRLGVQVEILNPFKKVALPKNLMEARKVAPMLATAVGLALRNAQECCQLKISLVPPKLKAIQSRRTKLGYNAGSALALVGIIGLILWRAIPSVVNKNAIIEAYNAEISKYEQYEPQLKDLQTKKGLLLGEYNLYSKYPLKSVDPVAPILIFADSLEGNSWVKSLEIKEKDVSVRGIIKSDTKVEELKQLSRLRVKLEKFCTEVKVGEQNETSEGLSFSLELKGVPDARKYYELKQKEDAAAQNQPSELKEKGA